MRIFFRTVRTSDEACAGWYSDIINLNTTGTFTINPGEGNDIINVANSEEARNGISSSTGNALLPPAH